MPDPELFRVQRLRVAREPTGSANFAQELSGSIGNFADVYFLQGEFQDNTDMLPDEGLIQEPYDERKDVVGRRLGELAVQAHLTGAPAALDSSASAPASPPDFALGRIFDVHFGGHRAGQGSTVQASSTDSLLNVGVGHGSRWERGAAIGTLFDGKLRLTEVDSIATDAITPRFKLPGSPTTSAEVYNAHTFYLTVDPDESLQFIAESADRADIWWLLGCQGNIGFELPNSGLPLATFQYTMADWKYDDEVGTPLSGSALARGTLTDPSPGVVLDSRLIFGPRASGTPHDLRLLRHSEVTITVNFEFQEVPAVHGVNNIRRWRLVPSNDFITGSITHVYEGTQHRKARDAGTEYYFFYEIGSAPTKSRAISIPRAQIKRVNRAEVNGMIGETVEFKALSPDPGTSDLPESPLLIHLA